MYTNELAILICPLSDLLKPYLKYIILIINNIDIANKNFESCFSKVFIPLIIRKPVIKKKITDLVDLVSRDKKGVGKISPWTYSIVDIAFLILIKNSLNSTLEKAK